jgi:hypothetical protein
LTDEEQNTGEYEVDAREDEAESRRELGKEAGLSVSCRIRAEADVVR